MRVAAQEPPRVPRGRGPRTTRERRRSLRQNRILVDLPGRLSYAATIMQKKTTGGSSHPRHRAAPPRRSRGRRGVDDLVREGKSGRGRAA